MANHISTAKFRLLLKINVRQQYDHAINKKLLLKYSIVKYDIVAESYLQNELCVKNDISWKHHQTAVELEGVKVRRLEEDISKAQQKH